MKNRTSPASLRIELNYISLHNAAPSFAGLVDCHREIFCDRYLGPLDVFGFDSRSVSSRQGCPTVSSREYPVSLTFRD